MSSKRRLRRRQCERKVGHSTLEHAVIAIKNTERFKLLRAYKCKFCKKWHIGRVAFKYINHTNK